MSPDLYRAVYMSVTPQASQVSVECTRESVSRYNRPRRLDKILRSPNAKYMFVCIILFSFFKKINKGDLPLMYSCVVRCEFID